MPDDIEPDTAAQPLQPILWIEPVFPPGVSDDIQYLASQQARQHYDRRVDTRESVIASTAIAKHTHKRLDAIVADIGKLDTDLQLKPGRFEVRSIIALAAAVFVLMLISFLKSKGVDTAAAITDTRGLLEAGHVPTEPAGGPSGTAPSTPPDSLYAPAGTPQ